MVASDKAVFCDWLIESGLDLAEDESANGETCPFCNGGSNNDHSFSVTKTQGGYLYHCYRASCGRSGFYSAQTEGLSRPAKPKAAQAYDWPLVPVSEVQRSSTPLRCLTSVELERAGVKYNQARDSFAFPIWDARGYQVGTVDRSYSGRKPKSITYWTDVAAPKLYFPRGVELFRDRVVIVEDILSAIVFSRHVPTVAVMGSWMTEGDAAYVSTLYHKGTFALDPDATKNSIALAMRYRILFPDGATVLPLTKDIKDMPDQQVRELLEGL